MKAFKRGDAKLLMRDW